MTVNYLGQFNLDIDPICAYRKKPGVTPMACLDACGLLIGFASGPGTMVENMEQNYFAFMGWTLSVSTEANVNERQQFTYPGDPPLDPLVKLFKEGEKEMIYIYQHGIVVVVADGGFVKYTRMD